MTLLVVVMLVSITAALCWTRHKKHSAPATCDIRPSSQADEQQTDSLRVSPEDVLQQPSPAEDITSMGNPIRFGWNKPVPTHNANVLSTDASIEVSGPARSRPTTERPDETRPQRSRIQTPSVRTNPPVTFSLRLVLMALGYSRIAFWDRRHFDVMPLTPEEIRRSDLPPTPSRHAQFWARARFGNTWYYPVAVCGPGDTHTTA